MSVVFLLLAVSLSARRAWIEIFVVSLNYKEVLVALRKESVDRNIINHSLNLPSSPSLSARRAWIEITLVQIIISGYARSLSARRAWIEISITQIKTVTGCGRSPQGERG